MWKLALPMVAVLVALWLFSSSARTRGRSARDVAAGTELGSPFPTDGTADPARPEPSPSVQDSTDRMRGTVRDARGNAVRGAKITEDRVTLAVTDAQGAFEFEWPNDIGPLAQLVVRHTDYLDLDAPRRRGESFDFVLRDGGKVSGRVMFLGGEPVEGWRIRARGARRGTRHEYGVAVSDARGHFEIRGMPEGALSLSYEDGLFHMSTSSRSGARDVQIRLTRPSILVQFESADGQAVTAGQFVVRTKGATVQRPAAPVLAETQPGDPIRVQAYAPGYRSTEWELPPLARAGVERRVLRLEASDDARVRLDVQFPDADRPEELRVFVRGTPRTETLRPPFTSIEIGDLNAGRVEFDLQRPDCEVRHRIASYAVSGSPRTQQVVFPRRVECVVEWPGGGSVVFTTLDHPEDPVVVALNAESAKPFHLLPGRYRVRRYLAQAATREEIIVVPDRKTFRFVWSD
ncbi:MAG: hypothetical protein AAGD14_08375 [Planctomycetota bacterium]